jgi:hypothetical protein
MTHIRTCVLLIAHAAACDLSGPCEPAGAIDPESGIDECGCFAARPDGGPVECPGGTAWDPAGPGHSEGCYLPSGYPHGYVRGRHPNGRVSNETVYRYGFGGGHEVQYSAAGIPVAVRCVLVDVRWHETVTRENNVTDVADFLCRPCP